MAVSAKYKLTDLAKDLALESKEIIEALDSLTGTQKKSGAVLETEEVDILLNHFTIKNSLPSFDAYFGAF